MLTQLKTFQGFGYKYARLRKVVSRVISVLRETMAGTLSELDLASRRVYYASVVTKN